MSDKSYSVITQESSTSSKSKKSQKSDATSSSSGAGSFTVLDSLGSISTGVHIEGKPAPSAWPMPPCQEDGAPVKKLTTPVEADEESILCADDNSPRLSQAGGGETVPTGGGSPSVAQPSVQQLLSHFNIDSLPTTQAHPDPAYTVGTLIAAAPVSQAQQILKEEGYGKTHAYHSEQCRRQGNVR